MISNAPTILTSERIPEQLQDVLFFKGTQHLPHDSRVVHENVQGPHVADAGLQAEHSHRLKENVQIHHEIARDHHRNVQGIGSITVSTKKIDISTENLGVPTKEIEVLKNKLKVPRKKLDVSTKEIEVSSKRLAARTKMLEVSTEEIEISSKTRTLMSPETSNGVQVQVDQILLQKTFRDGERHESLTTTKTTWERNGGESSDKDNEPTPRTIQAFKEKPSKEDKKTCSVDYQLRARKPNDPKISNNNIDKHTTNQKRGNYQSTSSSDSEGQEENEKIIRFQRKRSNFEEDESTIMTSLQSNGAERNTRSITREYEEDNKTCRALTGEEKLSHIDASNDVNKLAGKHSEYADGDKDFIPRHKDGEQEVKRIAHEGKGGVKRQGTPFGNTYRQQRSRSRIAESDRNPSSGKNRKSCHYHRHCRHHHRHYHRHNLNRSSIPSEQG